MMMEQKQVGPGAEHAIRACKNDNASVSKKIRECTAQSNNQRSQENEMSAHASIYTFLHSFTSTFERKWKNFWHLHTFTSTLKTCRQKWSMSLRKKHRLKKYI